MQTLEHSPQGDLPVPFCCLLMPGGEVFFVWFGIPTVISPSYPMSIAVFTFLHVYFSFVLIVLIIY